MKQPALLIIILIAALTLAACTTTVNSANDSGGGEVAVTTSEPSPTNTPAPSATNTTAPEPTLTEPLAEESKEEPAIEDTTNVAKNGKPLLDDQPRSNFESYWQTNFDLHTVPYNEIFSGGVPRDGIPPLDNPTFVTVEEAAFWLTNEEPIFVTTIGDQTKGYPLQIMTWHEIVNDELAGVPIAVTFCPLCNSAITFERTLNGTVYDFGVSGKLRNSDLIMWDRQTESWWQQLTGESIVGELVGEQLTFVPTQLVSFGDFKATFPDAQVLSRDTGFSRPYGNNPYTGYDSTSTPFLFDGKPDNRLGAVERVIAIDTGDEAVAYPYSVLAEKKVISDTVGGQDVVVFWQAGTNSALDSSIIANSKDVGAATVFDPRLDGQLLTFIWDGGAFVDDQTGSLWNIFGLATAGELAGKQLSPVNHANHLWFAWAAFRPETRIYQGG